MLPFLKNGVFFVMMYVLGVMCAYLTLPDRPGAEVYENLWLELFLDVYVASAVLALFPRKVRRWVRLVAYIILYSVAITDVFCYWKFGSTISPSMLMLVGETDSREAGEFFSTYLSPDVIFSPVGWILLLILVHIAVAMRRKLCKWCHTDYDKVVGSYRADLSNFLRRYMLYPECGVAVLAFVVWCATASWKNKEGMTQLMTANTIGTVEHILTEHDHGEFYLPIYRLAFSIYSNELASEQVGKCVEASQHVKVDSCSYKSPTIVLIIGESYSKAHCQLYGYPVKDTPRQKKLERSGWLTKFNDVVSCWNLTSFVFKMYSPCMSWVRRASGVTIPSSPSSSERQAIRLLSLPTSSCRLPGRLSTTSRVASSSMTQPSVRLSLTCVTTNSTDSTTDSLRTMTVL